MNSPMTRFTCALAHIVAATLHGAERTLLLAQAATMQTWLNAKMKQTEKEGALVLQLHEKIVAADDQISEAKMKVYTNTVSVPDRRQYYGRRLVETNLSVVSVMVPIKGGEFIMGSPETE